MLSHALQSYPGLDQTFPVSALNAYLDLNSSLVQLSEHYIEELLGHLRASELSRDDFYWLTLARINELALLCAGNYADHCEFRLVGDLLINPRRILVHERGAWDPVEKERHMPLTEQFSYVAADTTGVIEWLKRETLVEIRQEALLPALSRSLVSSGRFRNSFLQSIEERARKIASVAGMLANMPVRDGLELHRWMQTLAPTERRMMDSAFCRFDHDLFFELGEEIRSLLRDPAHRSRFLLPSAWQRFEKPAFDRPEKNALKRGLRHPAE